MDAEQQLPIQKQYTLNHYHQRFNWDCGISCILMILSGACRQNFLQNFDEICLEEGFGSNTWTVDLCFLLMKFNVRHEYFTKTLGVDPRYSQHSYYIKVIDKDEGRVKLKFKEAESHGLIIKKETVHFDYIVRHIALSGPVIVLTNASLLSCDICKKDSVRKLRTYAGHYVILCGYDLFRKKIYYHNPEISDGHVCLSSMESMDKARTAFGTDEDTIFLYLNETLVSAC